MGDIAANITSILMELKGEVCEMRGELVGLKSDISGAFKRIDEQRQDMLEVHKNTTLIVEVNQKLMGVISEQLDHEERIRAVESTPKKILSTFLVGLISAGAAVVGALLFGK